MSDVTYFEDLSVGQILRAGPLTITQEMMIAFSSVNDPQYFHVDPEAAEDSMFCGLIGSGWQTAALSFKLLIDEARFAGGVIGAHANIKWPRPLFPGDSISIECRITELAASRGKHDRGFVHIDATTVNQRGEVVQTVDAKLMVFRRGAKWAGVPYQG